MMDRCKRKEGRKKKGISNGLPYSLRGFLLFWLMGWQGVCVGGGSVGQAPAQCAPFVEKSSL